MSQSNLFDGESTLAPAQTSLFDCGQMEEEAPRSYLPDPDDIRRRLVGVLGKARRADRMPWSARDARIWQTVFPQMSNWLPEEEAKQLRLAFAQEIERLQLVAGAGSRV